MDEIYPTAQSFASRVLFGFLIHTWLQPGDQFWHGVWKPFKRFPANRHSANTWLKPGVNKKSCTHQLLFRV